MESSTPQPGAENPGTTSVAEAVQLSVRFFRELPNGAEARDLAVEEIDRSEDGDWLITLGFTPPGASLVAANVLQARLPREYKVFTVNTKDRCVTSMKIRTV